MQFTTNGRAAKRGRYVIADSTSVDIQPGERVGVGVMPGKENTDALVHEFGAAQAALPLYAVATAIASGKTIPVNALVGAFKETGKLDALAKAVAKAQEPQS